MAMISRHDSPETNDLLGRAAHQSEEMHRGARDRPAIRRALQEHGYLSSRAGEFPYRFDAEKRQAFPRGHKLKLKSKGSEKGRQATKIKGCCN
jgi:hypothetical protein